MKIQNERIVVREIAKTRSRSLVLHITVFKITRLVANTSHVSRAGVRHPPNLLVCRYCASFRHAKVASGRQDIYWCSARHHKTTGTARQIIDLLNVVVASHVTVVLMDLVIKCIGVLFQNTRFLEHVLAISKRHTGSIITTVLFSRLVGAPLSDTSSELPAPSFCCPENEDLFVARWRCHRLIRHTREWLFKAVPTVKSPGYLLECGR